MIKKLLAILVFFAAPVFAQHNVTLTWNASPTSGVSYNVYRSLQPSGAFAIAGNTAALTFIDSSVVAGSSYSYYVKALNSAGESVASAEVQSTVPTTAPPVCTSAISIGCRVKVTSASTPRSVRATGPASGYGAFIGSEAGGQLGTVIAGPNVSTLGFSWWQVEFDTCAFSSTPACTGWIASSQIVSTTGGTPPPPPPPLMLACAVNVCTVTGGASGQIGTIQIAGGPSATWRIP